jgi:hypothetical protein
MCFRTTHEARLACGLPGSHDEAALTFSKPKNLSLPSPRRGPAFTSSFSSGVGSGALGSFLTDAVPAAGLVGVCSDVSNSHCAPPEGVYSASEYSQRQA